MLPQGAGLRQPLQDAPCLQFGPAPAVNLPEVSHSHNIALYPYWWLEVVSPVNVHQCILRTHQCVLRARSAGAVAILSRCCSSSVTHCVVCRPLCAQRSSMDMRLHLRRCG
jgi:hypothetical protein